MLRIDMPREKTLKKKQKTNETKALKYGYRAKAKAKEARQTGKSSSYPSMIQKQAPAQGGD